jgi:hypothetical protein
MYIIDGYWKKGAKEWLKENGIFHISNVWLVWPMLMIPYMENWVYKNITKVIIFDSAAAMAFKLMFDQET